MKYREQMLRLAEEIMRILERGLLHQSRGVFGDFMRDPVASVKLLHYPPQAQEGEEAIGGEANPFEYNEASIFIGS